MNNYIFIPFGPIILLFDVLADLYYFWINNFRTDLKQIIIPKDDSKITQNSIKELVQITQKYNINKIKSVRCSAFIKTFRARFKVNQNIQFLIFGQMIPEGGFAKQGHGKGAVGQTTYKSLRTPDLRTTRQEEIQRLDDTEQTILSKHMLVQFNMLKKILVNFSFKDRAKLILVNDINFDVIDELRKERKIFMVLRDKGVDEYINMPMTEVDLYKPETHKELDQQL